MAVTTLKNRLKLNNLGKDFKGFLFIMSEKCNKHIIPNQALYRAEPHPEMHKNSKLRLKTTLNMILYCI